MLAEAMDIDTFIKKYDPAGRRSVLDSHREALIRLRDLGYTLAQMQQYLVSNEVTVSVQSISQFLAKLGRGRSAAKAAPAAAAAAAVPRSPAAGSAAPATTRQAEPVSEPGAAGVEDDQGDHRMSPRAARERKGAYYVDDAPNPLLKPPGDK